MSDEKIKMQILRNLDESGPFQPGTSYTNNVENPRFKNMSDLEVKNYIDDLKANNPGFGNNPNPTRGRYSPEALTARGLSNLTAQEAYLLEVHGHQPGSEFNKMNNVNTKGYQGKDHRFKKYAVGRMYGQGLDSMKQDAMQSGGAMRGASSRFSALDEALKGIESGRLNDPSFDVYKNVATEDLPAVNKAKLNAVNSGYTGGMNPKMNIANQFLNYAKMGVNKLPLRFLGGLGTGLALKDVYDQTEWKPMVDRELPVQYEMVDGDTIRRRKTIYDVEE